MKRTNLTNSPKDFTASQKIIYSSIIVFAFLLLLIIAGEITVRIGMKHKYAKPNIPPPFNTAQKDGLLGWKMTPNYSFSGTMKDAGGVEYPLDLTYDENGFKAFGDTASRKPKLLFIGDSFTASIEVSNEKSFFSLIGDSLEAEVFAYGHAGFGTLQEYMVFDKWVDKIRPDLVVWEVCSNDFIDNCAALEKVCGYKVGERRPYLQLDGSIVYERPLTSLDKVQEYIWLLRWLEEKWINAVANFKGEKPHLGEYYIATQQRAFLPFDESVKITERIIDKIKNRLPVGTKLIGFAADLYRPQATEFHRIFKANGFLFLEDPAMQVLIAHEHKKVIAKTPDQCHWNEYGHQLIASGLMEPIQQLIEVEDVAAN